MILLQNPTAKFTEYSSGHLAYRLVLLGFFPPENPEKGLASIQHMKKFQNLWVGLLAIFQDKLQFRA